MTIMFDVNEFCGKKVLITGASGLIGKAIAEYLLNNATGVKIVALARNEAKIRAAFNMADLKRVEFLICDINDLKPNDMGVDYVIHAACQTASKAFVENPVETIKGVVGGTVNVLEFARANNVKGFVYLSTMETYGTPFSSDKIYENSSAFLDQTSVRASYPESKRLAECLCAAYGSEYGVPTKIVRLTQTFGEGVSYDDRRVFAEFARCVIERKNIVLKTKGETERNYLYVGDAVLAILTVLLRGEIGQAYNAANEETYCSIFDMAQMVVARFGDGKIKVVFDEESNVEKSGYAPTLKMNLCCDKLKKLGWSATVGLEEMFSRLISSMKQSRIEQKQR